MKHRSPLITLAAVALAFAIMFTVNILSGPPGSSATGTASPVSRANDCRRYRVACSLTETALPRPPPARAKPQKTASSQRRWCTPAVPRTARPRSPSQCWVTRPLAISATGAISSPGFAELSRAGNISLKSKSGATLQAELDGKEIKGTVQIENDTLKFEIDEAKQAGRPLPGAWVQDDHRMDRP